MIDLGIDHLDFAQAPMSLNVDEVDLLVHLLDIEVLPGVLDAAPRFDSLPERDAVFRHAHETLTAAGLLDGDTVHPGLARHLRVLARPRAELALRRIAGGAVHRGCLVRGPDHAESGMLGVLAMRRDDIVALRGLDHDPVGAFCRMLGPAEVLHFGGVNCPTKDLSAALDRIGAPQQTIGRLVAAGAGADEATAVGPALATCSTFTEIVGYTHADAAVTVHGPVTVFDTTVGRIVGTTTVAADGVRWTSLSPGADGRLRQAVGALWSQLG